VLRKLGGGEEVSMPQPRFNKHNDPQPQTDRRQVDVRMQDGSYQRLDRLRVGEHWVFDLHGCRPCPRCGGRADGQGRAVGGDLLALRRDLQGTWYGVSGACSCVYGGIRHFGGLGWLDDLLDVPGPLTAQQWQAMSVARRPGMGWVDAARVAAQSLPVAAGLDLCGRISRWIAGDPPAYTPHEPRRRDVPEAVESAAGSLEMGR